MLSPKSMLLTGQWILTYESNSHSFQQVLEYLDQIQKWLAQTDLTPSRIRISINKRIKTNRFCFQNDTLNIFINEWRDQKLLPNHQYHYHQPRANLTLKSIKKILLLVPILLGDKRWNSLSLPASSLFLGSTLLNNHFQVRVEKLDLRFPTSTDEWLDYDLVGITLYEDLFPEITRWLIPFRHRYGGLLAAGGPMVTLTPLESAFHAPQFNLLVRGESEFVFPDILTALNQNNLENLLNHKGFIFHHRGLAIISEFQHINRPQNLNDFHFHADLLSEEHLPSGIEINLSRGCNQGCIFCSKVQGKRIRKLPVIELERLLLSFSYKLESQRRDFSRSRTININDDNILQDPRYAGAVFELIRKNRFKLWGVQTSIHSFFNRNQKINTELMALISDTELFVGSQPLVWLGTDAFLKSRGKKLGKWVPDENQLEILIQEFEKRGIDNFHYWISSDYHSDWQEFIEEFLFIIDLIFRFPRFGLLAHSPFLIPYRSTPLFKMLYNNPRYKTRIRYRDILKSPVDAYIFPLVERVETPFIHLNKLLRNESDRLQSGFFDDLNQEQYPQALTTVYHFLRQERILKNLEVRLEKKLSVLFP